MDAVEAPGAHSGWPRLRVDDWTRTRDTVHMWTQIVGKIRMAHTPMLNHWWPVTLYVTPRGLTTSTIPYGRGAFDIEFDFCDHQLHIRSSDGAAGSIVLEAKPVAEFHREVFETLGRLGIEASIRAVPNEVDPAIPFAEDHQHASYDPGAIRLFWQQLIQVDRVLNEFRSHAATTRRPGTPQRMRKAPATRSSAASNPAKTGSSTIQAPPFSRDRILNRPSTTLSIRASRARPHASPRTGSTTCTDDGARQNRHLHRAFAAGYTRI